MSSTGFSLDYEFRHDPESGSEKPVATDRLFPSSNLDRAIDATGLFSQYINGLEPNAKYTISAYVVTRDGKRFTGRPVTFRTNNSGIQHVTLNGDAELSGVTGRSFTIAGSVSNLGGSGERIYEYGVIYWPLSEPDSITRIKVAPESSEAPAVGQIFSMLVKDLLPDTEYQCRLYAANSRRAQYFPTVDIHTLPVVLPQVEIVSVTDVDVTSATVTIRLQNGGDPFTVAGFYYRTGSDAEAKYEFKTNPVEDNGSLLYVEKIYILRANSVYTFQAFASNYAGEVRSANTITADQTGPPSEPVVTTRPVVDHEGIGAMTAMLTGTITSDGGSAITEYGMEYGTNAGSMTKFIVPGEPVIDQSFNVEITGLTPKTQYYFRTYAISSMGTGVGETMTFTTGINGGMLQVGKQSATNAQGSGSIVSSNIPLGYFELEPLEVIVNDSVAGVYGQNARIYLLDRNLGARMPFPKGAFEENSTPNPVDGTQMSIADWSAWYGGYFFKWGSAEVKSSTWIIPKDTPSGQEMSALRPMLTSGEFTGNQNVQGANSGWYNDNDANTAIYKNGIDNWSGSTDPCKQLGAEYHIPTSFEWQAVSRALQSERGSQPVDLQFLNQRLRLGTAGERQANGQVPTLTAAIDGYVGLVTNAVAYMWSSTAVAQAGTTRYVYPYPLPDPGATPGVTGNWSIAFYSPYFQLGLAYAPTVTGSYWGDVGKEFQYDPAGKYVDYIYYDGWQKYGMRAREAFRALPIRCVRTEIY